MVYFFNTLTTTIEKKENKSLCLIESILWLLKVVKEVPNS